MGELNWGQNEGGFDKKMKNNLGNNKMNNLAVVGADCKG